MTRPRLRDGSGRRRWPWIVVVVTGLVLSAGWYLLSARIERVLADAQVDRAAAVVRWHAGEVAGSLLTAESAAELEYGSSAWREVQDIVEAMDPGSPVFVCVLDRDGRIMLHPRLAAEPALRYLDLAGRRLEALDGTISGPLTVLGSSPGVGRMHIPEPAIVATRMVGDHSLRLLVAWPQSSIDADVQARMRHVHIGAAIIAAVVLVVTGVGIRIAHAAGRSHAEMSAESVIPPW